MVEIIWYIYNDMLAMIRYVMPGVLVGGSLALATVYLLRIFQKRRNRSFARPLPIFLFCIYFSILCIITIFSRENGSRRGAADLELFSTWGINVRNNAYVIENVLLFIPYGFLIGWNFEKTKRFLFCTVFGFLTSLSIECFQLLTGRGYFQIDDILTNTLGTVAGYFFFRFFFGLYKQIGAWRKHHK